MESNGSLFRLIKRQKLSLVTYLRTNCNIAQSHDGKATFLKAGYPSVGQTFITNSKKVKRIENDMLR